MAQRGRGTGKRILIVNANWVGDVLFSTPAIRALRKKYPDAHLACLVPPRCRAVLANNPRLDEVLAADDRTTLASLLASIGTVMTLKRKRFDQAFLFHRSGTKARIVRLAGIPARIGYRTPGQAGLLTRAVEPPTDRPHKTDYFLRLLEAAGIPADGREPEFFPAAAADAAYARLAAAHGLREGEPYVVLHPGGNWDLKRWPASYFAGWARLFLKKFGWKVVICGTMPEKRLAESIRSMTADDRVVSVCGETSLDTLAVLLKRTKLFLSNDSGPIHLAASQKTPLIGLFGPTSPGETGPISAGPMAILRKGVGCEVPCYFRSCDYRVCMDLLTPEEVFEKTKEILRIVSP